MTSFPNQPSWYSEHLTPDLVQAARLEQVLYSGHTKYQSVSLIETASFGRMLILDGKTQSSESDEFIYHEALVQPIMVAHPRPEHIFVAGGGEGATIREVLKHTTVRQVQMVDLDQEVVELCRKYLPNHHAGSFEDVRTSLHFEDALAYTDGFSNREDYYLLVVLKPSGMLLWEHLKGYVAELRKNGRTIDIGLDLIAERYSTTNQFINLQ